jgi:hypothetical protein
MLHNWATCSCGNVFCQDAPPLPDDDLITVSDVLLVMDQAGSGQLTAAMLEVPPTPDSRAEPWAVAAAAAAAVNS